MRFARNKYALLLTMAIASACSDAPTVARVVPRARPSADVVADTSSTTPSGAPAIFTDSAAPVAAKVGVPRRISGLAASFSIAVLGNPIVRIYKDNDAWSYNGGRDEATLRYLGLVKGTDFFVHPTSALANGVPSGTSVVIITANAAGLASTTANVRSSAAQQALATFLSGGGKLLVDLADNDFSSGYLVPGSTGTPNYVFPAPCEDATLATAAAGPDGIFGTADDHPFVRGPDGLAGTADDMTSTNIDMWEGCYLAHGNLADGFTLPAGARVLATAMFSTPKPIMAEYCLGPGRVIVNTLTLGFIGHQPASAVGFDPPWSYTQRNLYSYALSGASSCNRPPTASTGGPYTGTEGTAVSLTWSASDPDADALTYSWDFGDGSTGTGTTLPTSHTYADNGTYTVSLTADDGKGGTDTKTTSATIANVAPTLGLLSGPASPLAIGASAAISGSFTDPGSLDTHTGSIDWGDANSSAGSIGGTNTNGSIGGSHSYAAAGVYTVSATVTDKDGDTSNQSSFQYVVVYDPSAGFVTGGGWILSPADACQVIALCGSTEEGKASFGFVSRYQKGATVPTGNTQFVYHAGNFVFASTSYDWLVISGPKAQYKGSGTIGGQGDYGFLLTATDGQVSGGGGVDQFRIKIWDKSTGSVIYDNVPGSADDLTSGTQPIAGGSIQIQSK